MDNKLTATINNIVIALFAITGAEMSVELNRIVGAHVRAMFNWSKQNDRGAIGWQMGVLYQVLKGGSGVRTVETPLNTLGAMVDTFEKEIKVYHDLCDIDRQAKRQEIRARSALAFYA